jgi:hypothetical protein
MGYDKVADRARSRRIKAAFQRTIGAVIAHDGGIVEEFLECFQGVDSKAKTFHFFFVTVNNPLDNTPINLYTTLFVKSHLFTVIFLRSTLYDLAVVGNG